MAREREEVEVLLGVQFEVKASLGEDEYIATLLLSYIDGYWTP